MNLIKRIFCCVLITIAFLLPGCSNSKNNNLGDSSTPTSEEYYEHIGYHKITFSKNIIISSEPADTVGASENKILIKNNAEITISYNTTNTDYVYNNGIYINKKEGTFISAFQANENFIDTQNATVKVKDDLIITEDIKDYSIHGIAAYYVVSNTNEESNKFKEQKFSNSEILKIENNTAITLLNHFKFIYTSGNSIADFKTDKLQTNVIFKSSTINLSLQKFQLNICLDTYFETLETYLYLILEDEQHNLYFQKLTNGEYAEGCTEVSNLSNKNSNLHTVKITITKNLEHQKNY